MIYSFLRGQSYWIPIVGLVFYVFWGFKLNKLFQCIGIISPRMDEVLELVASVDFEPCPPHSHPVSSLRPRLASLFWASRNCWRAFARGTSSWKTCRVLMVMRVQKIWKNVIAERLSGQSASAEKSNTHSCCKALGKFGVATIQNDAATNHHQWHLACTRIFRYRYGSKWHAMKCLQPSLDSFQTEPPAQAPSPSPSHAWALDGRGTKNLRMPRYA